MLKSPQVCRLVLFGVILWIAAAFYIYLLPGALTNPARGAIGFITMMVDGIALRWFPAVYGADPVAVRLGAAWLLWGYGVSLGVAVLITARRSATFG